MVGVLQTIPSLALLAPAGAPADDFVLEGGRVHERLERGAGLAMRVHGAIELGIGESLARARVDQRLTPRGDVDGIVVCPAMMQYSKLMRSVAPFSPVTSMVFAPGLLSTTNVWPSAVCNC